MVGWAETHPVSEFAFGALGATPLKRGTNETSCDAGNHLEIQHVREDAIIERQIYAKAVDTQGKMKGGRRSSCRRKLL